MGWGNFRPKTLGNHLKSYLHFKLLRCSHNVELCCVLVMCKITVSIHTHAHTHSRSTKSFLWVCLGVCVWSPVSNLRSTALRGLHRKSIKLRYTATEFKLLLLSPLNVPWECVAVVAVASGRWQSLQHKTNIGDIPAQQQWQWQWHQQCAPQRILTDDDDDDVGELNGSLNFWIKAGRQAVSQKRQWTEREREETGEKRRDYAGKSLCSVLFCCCNELPLAVGIAVQPENIKNYLILPAVVPKVSTAAPHNK